MSSHPKSCLKRPSVISWQGKDVYVYAVESTIQKQTKKPDLEFVIYIPIQSAVRNEREKSSSKQDLEPNEIKPMEGNPSKELTFI